MGHTHNDHSYYEDYSNFDKWIKKAWITYVTDMLEKNISSAHKWFAAN